MRSRYIHASFVLAIAAGCTGLYSAQASAGTLYTVNEDSRNLLAIDTNTLAVTTVGSTGVASGRFGDLAYDPTGHTLYWAAGRDNSNLYTINLSTGAATLVGNSGVNNLFALGWNATALYGQASDGQVYMIDPGTANATLIGSNSVYPGGYDYNPDLGKMVLLEAGQDSFYTVDLTNGSTATLLSGSSGIDDNDLAYAHDLNAYFAADYSGNLYRYDATTFARSTPLSGLGRLATLAYVPDSTPVPEPGSFALFSVGLLGLGWKRRHNTGR